MTSRCAQGSANRMRWRMDVVRWSPTFPTPSPLRSPLFPPDLHPLLQFSFDFSFSGASTNLVQRSVSWLWCLIQMEKSSIVLWELSADSYLVVGESRSGIQMECIHCYHGSSTSNLSSFLSIQFSRNVTPHWSFIYLQLHQLPLLFPLQLLCTENSIFDIFSGSWRSRWSSERELDQRSGWVIKAVGVSPSLPPHRTPFPFSQWKRNFFQDLLSPEKLVFSRPQVPLWTDLCHGAELEEGLWYRRSPCLATAASLLPNLDWVWNTSLAFGINFTPSFLGWGCHLRLGGMNQKNPNPKERSTQVQPRTPLKAAGIYLQSSYISREKKGTPFWILCLPLPIFLLLLVSCPYPLLSLSSSLSLPSLRPFIQLQGLQQKLPFNVLFHHIRHFVGSGIVRICQSSRWKSFHQPVQHWWFLLPKSSSSLCLQFYYRRQAYCWKTSRISLLCKRPKLQCCRE